ETPTFHTLRDTGLPSTAPRRPPLRPTAFSGCLNCSRVGELTARLATLEAQVARLAVAEPPTPAEPKGGPPGRGQLWGSPAARGSPGDDGKVVRGDSGSDGGSATRQPRGAGRAPGCCQYIDFGGTPSWTPHLGGPPRGPLI
ncbi:EMI domain-containing protein 1-like, partial [Corapipo altera]|uniref:EMI domain-containing protein 1-like n=1 Tax=Corapipo altera TaxID=415028 RepID=UPI000FD63738